MSRSLARSLSFLQMSDTDSDVQRSNYDLYSLHYKYPDRSGNDCLGWVCAVCQIPALDPLKLSQESLEYYGPHQDTDLDFWVRCEVCSTDFHLTCGQMFADLPEYSAQAIKGAPFFCCEYEITVKKTMFCSSNFS